MLDILCPYCGSRFEAILEYVPGSYSEHRDHNGYECENYQCGAQWDNQGYATKGPRENT